MKVAVIAGTSEATDLINLISEAHSVTAFTATSYGTEILSDSDCEIKQGRLDEAGFLKELSGFDAVADMSHPFAEIVSVTVKSVCEKLGIPYFRGGREQLCYDYDKITYADSKEEAAGILKNKTGSIFLTTGVKTLAFYEEQLYAKREQIYARILDSRESRELSAASELNLIYAVPPFSEEDTRRILEKHDIKILVSKDSGRRGGLPEKISAAEKCGTEVILIKSPESELSNSPEKIKNLLEGLEIK